MTQSYTQAMFDEALHLHKAGMLRDADRIYQQILAIEPRHVQSLHLRGMLGYQVGQHAAAIELIQMAIHVRNDVPLFYNDLANVLKACGKLDEAIKNYKHALTIDQGYIPAHFNLANILIDQSKFKEAIVHYEHVVSLDPKSVNARHNLGLLLQIEGRFDDAMGHFQTVVKIEPNNAEAHYNLGALLQIQGQLDDAMREFRTAITLKPDHAAAHFSEAMALLLAGDLTAGWNKYEWRWRIPGAKPFETTKPLWDGSSLEGKTIFLRGEQGFGDSLQFIRYVPLVKNYGAKILLKCSPGLARLFKTLDSIDQIITNEDNIPHYDCYAPLMSLPKILGTTLETIPNSVPYLSPSSEQVKVWSERLKPTAGLRVGLVWAGSPRLKDFASHAVDRRRSLHISQLAPFASISDIQFYSLQKGEAAKQIEMAPEGLTIIDYMNDVQDFADTAAFIANLDLVIGVDTSVIHLAGAMGKPVWVLSRFDGCWRWLLNRENSPWYPTMRLFRQPRLGDWRSVIEDVRASLIEKVQS